MPSLAICGVLCLYSPVCIRLGRVRYGGAIRTAPSGEAGREDDAELHLSSGSVF